MLSPCRPHKVMQTQGRRGEVTMRGPAGLNRAEPGRALTRSPQHRSRCDITVGGGDRDNGENVSGS